MTNKKMLLTAVTALLVCFGPALAEDGYDDESYEPPEDRQKIEFTTGYQGSSTEDELGRVAEYEVVEPNAIAGLFWETSPYDRTRFSMNLERLSSDQFGGNVSLDLDRAVRVQANTVGFLHRLDHDPLTNLQAVSEVKVVRSTDFEPGSNYQTRYRLYDVQAEFQPPQLEWFKFRGGLRRDERKGTHQVLNNSHCTSCHVTAKGREVDRETTDVTLGFHVRKNRFDVDYEMLSRRFDEGGQTPTAPFEKAYHPGFPAGPAAGLQTPFNDRVWFQDGDFSINLIPKTRRDAHRIQARTDFNDDALTFTVVQSKTENRETNLEYEFQGFRGRYVWRPADELRVNFYARRDELDNDEILINLLDLNGLASAPVTMYPGFTGPLTFEEWRQLVDDPTLNFTEFVRQSSLDRTEDRLGLDAYWRPWRRSSMRLGYEYRNVDRDNVVLANGSGETEQHRLKLGWNQRILKRLRWNNSLTYTSTDNPYVNVDGGRRAFAGFSDPINQIVLGNAPSPKSPASLQYYQLHGLRVADLGSSATEEMKLRSNATWSPKARWALNGNVRYRDADNDELDYSTWDHQTVGLGANLWVAAGPRLQFTVGVDHLDQETEAIAYIPLMDG